MELPLSIQFLLHQKVTRHPLIRNWLRRVLGLRKPDSVERPYVKCRARTLPHWGQISVRQAPKKCCGPQPALMTGAAHFAHTDSTAVNASFAQQYLFRRLDFRRVDVKSLRTDRLGRFSRQF